MKLSRKAVFIAMTLAGSQLWGAASATSDCGDVLKLRLAGGRPIVDCVFLNGQGPYRFLIDTGAQSNQVDAAIAGKLDVTPTFRVSVVTATGTTQIGGTRLAEVTVGAVRSSDQEFLFSKLDGIHALSSDIQGVIGEEFLSHFDYLLDLRGRTLQFGAPAPAGEHVLIEPTDGCPTVVTSLGRLILDSGSDIVVLFSDGVLFSEGKGIASSRLQTAAGSAFVQPMPSQRVRIGSRNWKTVQTVMAPGGGSAADGLIPLSVFKRVYISNTGGYSVIE